jgi:DNA-binding IscR family transcriptional regulator
MGVLAIIGLFLAAFCKPLVDTAGGSWVRCGMENISLSDFLLGKRSARRALLEELFRHPSEAVHLRELARRTGFSSPMIAKELANLVAAGVVTESRAGQQRLFRANLQSPLAGDVLRLTVQPSRTMNRVPIDRASKDAQKRRPRSLCEATVWGHALGNRDAMLREFLDEFYLAAAAERAGMLDEEPPLLLDDERANAYYAAVAEHLAMKNGLPAPAWVHSKARFLRRPFFPAGLESLKATLLVESPPAFRRRMIFVEREPLYRPRQAPQAR